MTRHATTRDAVVRHAMMCVPAGPMPARAKLMRVRAGVVRVRAGVVRVRAGQGPARADT